MHELVPSIIWVSSHEYWYAYYPIHHKWQICTSRLSQIMLPCGMWGDSDESIRAEKCWYAHMYILQCAVHSACTYFALDVTHLSRGSTTAGIQEDKASDSIKEKIGLTAFSSHQSHDFCTICSAIYYWSVVATELPSVIHYQLWPASSKQHHKELCMQSDFVLLEVLKR